MNGRVKFYSINDLCYGMYLDKITACTVPELVDIDINDAIEFYQINLYFENGARSTDWSDEQYESYYQKQKKLYSLAMRYFNNLSDNNIEKEYGNVEIGYKEAFWELFDKCKLFNIVSTFVFDRVIHLEHVSPYHIFNKKNIVNRYGEVLRQYILQNIFMYKFLVDVYEQEYNNSYKKLYLPNELKNEEICECLSKYIESKEADFNILDSIFRMRETKRFPISDEIRLKASNRYEDMKKEIGETGVRFEHGIQLVFSKEQTEPKKFETKGNVFIASYSVSWLLDSLDFPSILNNFLYMFEYADIPQMRCNLTSKKIHSSVFEDIFGAKKLSCYYPINNMFNLINAHAQMQMAAYYDFLDKQDIHYEDVLKYFFTEYLQEEFNCSEIKILFPSQGTNYFEKCTTLCTAIDSILKQFSLYVRHKEIDPKLISISSSSVKFLQIPSLVDDKYIYGTGDDFDWFTFALFSDQCTFSFVERISNKGREYETLYDLLNSEDIYLTDYHEREKPSFMRLAEKNLITISPEGKLSLGNNLKLRILRDLYVNEVISRYHYAESANKIFEKWIQEGLLTTKSGLFSEPEVNYLNFILNHAEYVNGWDLRNKYSHGVQVALDDSVHKQNYFILLIVLTILAIKINDDFILNEELEKRKHDS